jgi:hypothetical protein
VQQQAEIEAILAAQQAESEDMEVTFQVPILKLCQSLTKEVKAGDAEEGEFLNTLTSESYGNKVEFVVAFVQKGRSASAKDGRYFVSISQDLIPEAWADLVGEEFVGTPFSEYPDAEEQYKKRVNAGEIEWGKGPQVSTTYNYTGLVLSDEEDGEPMPVRIALLRSTKKAHDKFQTLYKATMRNKPWWDNVFTMESKEETFGRNTSFVIQVKKTRETTGEERTLAVELASAIMAGRVTDNAESAAEGEGKREAPDAKGGLAV